MDANDKSVRRRRSMRTPSSQGGRALHQRSAESDHRRARDGRARRHAGAPIAGKDFKSGPTLLKSVLAPMLKARMPGLGGRYSTNILGNRDGEVLETLN